MCRSHPVTILNFGQSESLKECVFFGESTSDSYSNPKPFGLIYQIFNLKKQEGQIFLKVYFLNRDQESVDLLNPRGVDDVL